MDWKIWLARIYNSALSQQQIQSLYLEWLRRFWPTNLLFNNTDFTKYSLPNLQDWLVLDISRAAVSWTYYDQSWNGNNSTTVTAVTDTAVWLNNSMSFNWSTSKIDIPDFNYNMTTSFTYSAWVNINNYTDSNWIIEQDSTSNRWTLFRTDVTTWKLQLVRLNSWWTVLTNIQSTSALWTWIWKMVTATFNNTIGSKIFIDWVQVASDTVLTNTNDATTPINIWARETGLNNFMDWFIIGARIWNRALTVNEVQQLRYSNFLKN